MSLISTIGGVIRIVRRSLRQHAVSTVITAGSVALASGLVMAVFSINAQAYDAFTSGGRGFDAVLGARGSQLQLVLNSVFQLETSNGNIPYSLYTWIKKDPRVALAIPYAVGDNYKGYRIVGTTLEIFNDYEPRPGEHLVFAQGRPFDPEQKEAVIGSQVAARIGLKLGDVFNSYHGLFYDPKMMHPDRFTVVGIIAPTNGPMDRVIWIPIEAIYRMTGHVLQGSGKGYVPQAGVVIPDANKEVSAVMLKFHSPEAGFMLDMTVNRQGKVATLAWPIAKIVAEVFEKVGWVSKVLTLVAYLIVVVAAASILASIYNTMNERRREFAILRALGARQRIILLAVVLESAVIAAMGAIAGFAVYAGLLAAASVTIRIQTGVVLEVWRYDPVLVITPLAMVALGALTGIVPAVKAYLTDVATNLAPAS